MAKRKAKADPKAWRKTEEGWRKYRECRAEAQAPALHYKSSTGR